MAPLGAGGMGEVYRAKDIRLDRIVAVKVLSCAMHQREDIRQRFEREARAVSKLNHPHICTIARHRPRGRHRLSGNGGAWSRDGFIVYSPKLSSRLWKVAATGGEPVTATILDGTRGDARHNFPQFLPDGRHFLLYAHSTDPRRSGPHIGSLDEPAKIEAIPQLRGNAFQAVYAPSGILGTAISSTFETDRSSRSLSTPARSV